MTAVSTKQTITEPTIRAYTPTTNVDPRPDEVLRSSVEVVDQDTQELKPDYVSIYTSSILAVSVIFLVGVGLPVSIYLDDYVGGFGLGAFCAFWGGPSFGVMTGAARVSSWLERNEGAH